MNDNRQTRPQDLLPEPTLRRLPWYLAYVTMLQADNIEYVSSTRIAEELNVDASQIAKDLSFVNIKGKTRIGYEVNKLASVIRDFLGFDCTHNAVMVGVGSLGAALMQDTGLLRYGLNIVAGVDINPSIVGKSIHGITISHANDLANIVKAQNIQIGIIAVPVDSAQAVADNMMDAGIRALWNFTPYRIRAREGIVITNTSIYSHLAVMYNRLNSLNI
jgi:redox-sensing transcriptional repressor